MGSSLWSCRATVNRLPYAPYVAGKTAKKSPKVLLVDGTNAMYRAFFAIPNLKAPDGPPTNAAYGLLNTVLKVLRDEQPDVAVMVFDARGKSFRHEVYAESTRSVYRRGDVEWDYAGWSTSFVTSSLLRTPLAIAELPLELAEPGSEVDLEVQVVHVRKDSLK